MDVPKLSPPSLSAPRLSAPRLNPPKLTPPGVTSYNVYNRNRTSVQRQHVKDLGDLILGKPGVGTLQLRHTLNDAGLGNFTEIPILNSVLGFGVMLKERALDPLLEGDTSKLLINSLESIAGSMDILANPVKSLMPWAGGGGPTDFAKSLGWAEDEYRQQYNWNTGSSIVDFVGEVISDPLNWFTWGANAAGKTGTDLLLDTTKQIVAKEAGETLASTITDAGYRNISKVISDALTDSNDKLVSEIVDRLSDNRKYLIDEIQKVSVTNPKYKEIQEAITAYNQLLSLDADKQLANIIKDIRVSDGYNQYLQITKFTKAVATVNDAIIIASMGIAPAWGIGKTVFEQLNKHVFKAQWNAWVQSRKKIDPKEVMNNTPAAFRRELKTIGENNYKLNQKTYETFADILKRYNVSTDYLQQLYVNVYKNATYAQRMDKVIIDQMFKERLASLMPELNSVIYEGRTFRSLQQIADLPKGKYTKFINKPSVDYEIMQTIKEIRPDDIENLCESLWEYTVIADAAETSMYNEFKNQINEEVKAWFEKTDHRGTLTTGNELAQLDYAERIEFIVSNYFEIDGVKYGLADLPKYLDDLNAKYSDMFIKVSSLLDYAGINKDNYKQIISILGAINQYKSDTKTTSKLFKKLRKIVTAARTGELLRQESLSEGIHNIHKAFLSPKNVDLKYMNTKEFRNLADEFSDVGAFYENVVDVASKFDDVKILPEIQEKISKIVGELDETARIELDQALGTYINPTEERSEVIDKVLSFVFDADEEGNLSRESVTQFVENLQELQTQVGRWVSDIKADRIKFTLPQQSMITNLDKYLTQDKMMYTIDNLLDIIEETDNAIYYMQMSKQGMFWLAHDELVTIYDSWTKEHQKWFNDITDPNSVIRGRIAEVVKTLDKEGKKDEAKYIESIIASLEKYNASVVLLSTNICDYEISKQLQQYLSGLLFNIYRKYDNNSIASMMVNIDTLVNGFMEQLHRDWKYNRVMQDLIDNSTMPTLIKEGTALTDTEIARYNELKLLLDGTMTEDMLPLQEELNALEYKMMDQVVSQTPSYYAVMDNIRQNVKNAFNNYVTTVGAIDKLHPDINLTWGSDFFTSNTITQIQRLGLAYQDVLRVLNDTTHDVQLVKDASDFIMYVGAEYIERDFSYIEDLLPKLLTQENGIKDYEEYFKQFILDYINGADSTLSRLLIRTFNDIDQINMGLQQANGRIKIYNGKGRTTVHNVAAYITKEKFDAFVRQNLNVQNAYEWSTTNGMLAVKKIDKWDFLAARSILPEFLNIPGNPETINTSLEYATFFNRFKACYDYIDKFKVFRPETIKAYRQALIEIYQDPTIFFGPKDPNMYFRRISDKDVYAWYMYTKNPTYNKKISVDFQKILQRLGHLDPTTAQKDEAKQMLLNKIDFTYGQRLDYNEDPASVFFELEDIANRGVTDEDVYTRIINNAPLNTISDIRQFATRDIRQYYKSPETMKANITNIQRYHEQDVEALEHTRVLDDLCNDTTKVGKRIKDKEQREILKSYGITSDTKMNDKRVQRFMLEERMQGLAMNLNSYSPKELRSFIDYNTDGMLFFQTDAGFDTKFTSKELQKAGLEIKYIENNKDIENIFLIRRTDNTIRPKCHKYVVPTYIFDEEQQAITDMFKANRDYFYWDGMDLPDELFTGQMLDLDNYNILKESDILRKYVGDLALQKTYSKIDENGINNFFKKKILRPNLVMVGHYDTINNVYNLGMDAFLDRGMDVPLATTDLYRSAFGGTMAAVKRVNSEHKYLHMFMNDDYAVKTLKPMFRKATDEEINNFFEKGYYVAAIMRENRKGEPTIYKIHITNRTQLNEAIKAGAVCLPHEVYRNAVLAVNEHAISNKVYKAYKQFLVSTFKSIYLTTPGFLMRNFLDTAIYKNAASSGGLLDIGTNMQYYSKATQLWAWYNDVQKKMLKSTNNKTLNKRIVRAYLRNMTDEERINYMLVDMFAMSSASGGLSDALEDMLLKYNLADGASVTELWLNAYNEKILYGKYSPVRLVNDINSQIEQSSRLGLFLKLVDEGKDFTEAIHTITNTHFDYKLKEPYAKTIEEIFWFSTFPINNLFYYLNEGITKNPDVFRAWLDLLEVSYNNGDYTWDDVRNSNYLQYNFLAGNVRLKVFGNNIMLKTGMSPIGFFTLLVSPFSEFKERINPFLGVMFGLEDPKQLNPFSSNIARLEAITQGRSYVPSVYAKMYPKHTRKYPKLYREFYYTSSWRRYPRRRFYAKDNRSFMNYKFTTNRYYFSRGKNIDRWLSSTNSIAPNWYMNNYRRYKSNSKYNRATRKLKLPDSYRQSVSK